MFYQKPKIDLCEKFALVENKVAGIVSGNSVPVDLFCVPYEMNTRFVSNHGSQIRTPKRFVLNRESQIQPIFKRFDLFSRIL
jgi:hypothetical protein